MSIEILILLLLIIANGVFSMSEAAVISARKARLQQRAEEGSPGAQAALKLTEDPGRFLSTVQIGITLIGILSGAFGGSAVAESIAPLFLSIPALAPYSGALSITLVVLLVTYLSLVIGELVPKQLALNDPEKIASFIARPMNTLSTLTAPVVSLLTWSTNLVLRLIGARKSEEPPVTQEEVEIMLEQGAQAGVFESVEHELVANVFRLSDRRVRAVMTPRTDMTWLDLDDPIDVTLKKMVESTYTYFPVFQKDMQHLAGVVSVKDIWARQVAGEPFDLRAVLLDPLVIPSGTPALKALESFRDSGEPIALLLDEHGDIEGLVTLSDLLEAIVGEIAEDDETTQETAVQREDGSWLFDGLADIDQVEDMLDAEIFPVEERGDYETLGGFVMMRIGRIPTTGDHFEWQGVSFEVLDMDGRRVDKVLVRRLQTGTDSKD